MANFTYVFIHGAGGSARIWAEQLAAFPNSIAVTLVGHNPSDLATVTVSSIEGHAHHLHELLRELGDVVLVGHSMGGAIAQLYALIFPEKVRGLVLVGSGAKMRVSPKILEGLLTDYPATVRFIVNTGFPPDAPDNLKQPIIEDMDALPPEVTQAAFAACNQFDVTQNLNKLPAVPVLVVTGTADMLTPPKLGQFLADNIPGARLELVEGVGHFVQVEQPAELNRLLGELRIDDR